MGDLLNEDRIAVIGAQVVILGVAYKSNVSDMRADRDYELGIFPTSQHGR